MKRFTWIEEHGAAVALMTGVADGDCGWEGCASGSRSAFLAQAPIPAEKLVVLRQCHGDEIWAVGPEDAGKGAKGRDGALGDGDGLMTACPGIPLGINIADCVPVFLCGGGVVAVAHAGRVGTEMGIAARTVAQIGATYGVAPESLFALIGPSAGPCCYRVGPEVLESATRTGVLAQGERLDLWETNRFQLREAGLPDGHIVVDGVCTICQSGYFSYRARGTVERNLAIIMG
jgi:YfiH family protein